MGFASRYLERVWGSTELLRFVGIVTVLSNIITFGFAWLVYLVIGSVEACWDSAFRGTCGLQAGFLVAFTQLIPEHQVQVFGKLKLKVKVGWLGYSGTARESISHRWLITDPPRHLHPHLQRTRPRHRPSTIHEHPVRLLRRLGLSPFLQIVRRRAQQR